MLRNLASYVLKFKKINLNKFNFIKLKENVLKIYILHKLKYTYHYLTSKTILRKIHFYI